MIDSLEAAGQFAILVGEVAVPVLSLPPGVFDEIQADFGQGWMDTLLSPTRRPAAAVVLVDAARKKAGAEPAEFDIASLVRLFVKIPGDLPDAEPSTEGATENPTDAS